MIKRGEIYWANLDLTIGTEIKKTRPVLIVSNDQNNQFSSTVTILPITTNTEKIYPFEVFLKKEMGGIPQDCKVKAEQIRTIDKQRLKGNPLGPSLDSTTMDQVDKAVKLHLSLQ